MMFNSLKYISLIFSFSGISFSLSAQHDFVLKGKLTGASREGEKVTFSYFDGKKTVYTATPVKDGMFEFKGAVPEPTKGSLSMSIPKSEIGTTIWVTSEKTEFYMEGGAITVEGPRISAVAVKSGGRSQKEFLKLQAIRKPFVEKEKESYNEMLNALRAKDSVNSKRLRILNDQAKASIDSAELAYVRANPGSFVSLHLVKDRATPKAFADNPDKMAKLYKGLGDGVKKSLIGTQLAGQVDMSYKLAPGKKAIEFTMKDTLGNPVALSSFRGKYVLLDFWASWCIPCRFENPGVVKAYNQFKDKNFTVLSVSLEKPGDQKAWMDAIHKDGLTWTHVSDLDGFAENKTAQSYGIQSIPMNFLIDPDGTIIALHLRGEALQKKLEEVIK